MERTFKHKKTGELATYKDGIFKQGRFTVEIGVEPSSEFWEEVVTKDYKIISWVDEKGNVYEDEKPIGAIIGNDVFCVTAVERVYDGEYFGIGMGVTTDFLSDGIQYINKFELEDNKLSIQLLKKDNPHFVSYRKLDKLKRVEVIGTDFYGNDILKYSKLYSVSDTFDLYKTDSAIEENIKGVRCFVSKDLAEKYIVESKVLFTTLDNVELKHGDKFYTVDTKFFKIFEAEAGITFKTEKWIKNSYHRRELAEEWIIMNKPVLSLNDLLDNWCTDTLYDVYKESPMFKNFKRVAENKIKNQ